MRSKSGVLLALPHAPWLLRLRVRHARCALATCPRVVRSREGISVLRAAWPVSVVLRNLIHSADAVPLRPALDAVALFLCAAAAPRAAPAPPTGNDDDDLYGHVRYSLITLLFT